MHIPAGQHQQNAIGDAVEYDCAKDPYPCTIPPPHAQRHTYSPPVNSTYLALLPRRPNLHLTSQITQDGSQTLNIRPPMETEASVRVRPRVGQLTRVPPY